MGVPDPEKIMPLTDVGVIAPKVSEMAGVVVAVATVPLTPLAEVTDTVETPPAVAGAHAVPFHCKTWPLLVAPIELKSAAAMAPSRIWLLVTLLAAIVGLGKVPDKSPPAAVEAPILLLKAV